MKTFNELFKFCEENKVFVVIESNAGKCWVTLKTTGKAFGDKQDLEQNYSEDDVWGAITTLTNRYKKIKEIR